MNQEKKFLMIFNNLEQFKNNKLNNVKELAFNSMIWKNLKKNNEIH